MNTLGHQLKVCTCKEAGCKFCDGGLQYCERCKGGEIELEQSCAERLAHQLMLVKDDLERTRAERNRAGLEARRDLMRRGAVTYADLSASMIQRELACQAFNEAHSKTLSTWEGLVAALKVLLPEQERK